MTLDIASGGPLTAEQRESYSRDGFVVLDGVCSPDLVDQLCLSIAPLLAGAGAGRIAAGRTAGLARKMALASILYEDGFSMLRYRRFPTDLFKGQASSIDSLRSLMIDGATGP